jgi:hypothetical protein
MGRDPFSARPVSLALAALLLWSLGAFEPVSAGTEFPRPDRPVADIVTSGYSDEATRDRQGEAERVLNDNDKPTQDHGTPPALLRCELAAVGYRQVDLLLLAPADGYLAVFEPPAVLPPVASIRPCGQ